MIFDLHVTRQTQTRFPCPCLGVWRFKILEPKPNFVVVSPLLHTKETILLKFERIFQKAIFRTIHRQVQSDQPLVQPSGQFLQAF